MVQKKYIKNELGLESRITLLLNPLSLFFLHLLSTSHYSAIACIVIIIVLFAK
jgi:hypothetical protein